MRIGGMIDRFNGWLIDRQTVRQTCNSTKHKLNQGGNRLTHVVPLNTAAPKTTEADISRNKKGEREEREEDRRGEGGVNGRTRAL